MSARLSVAVSFGANFYFFGVQFATGIVLARLLSPAEMGIYAVAMAAYWIINAFQNLGLTSFMARERTLTPETLGTLYTVAGAQAVLLAGLLFAAAPGIAAFTGSPDVTAALRILCLYALVTAVHTIAGGLMTREMQFVRFSVTHIIAVTVGAGVTLWLAANGWSALSMPWGATAGSAVGALVALCLVGRHRAGRPGVAEWRRVWSFGSSLLTANLIANVCARAPDLLLARFSGIAATGLYNRAAGLVDVFNNSVLVSYQRVMQTLFAQNRDALGDFRDAYVRSVAVITGLVWPAYTGLGVLAAPVISLLYGPKWVAAAPALSLICAAGVIGTALSAPSQALIAAGEERRLPRLEAMRGVVAVALFTAAAPFGIAAAAASRVADALFGFMIYRSHVYRAAKVRSGDMAPAHGRSVLVTIAAAAPGFAIMTWFGWPLSLPPHWLAAAICGGAVTWVAALFLTRHELRIEIRRALTRGNRTQATP